MTCKILAIGNSFSEDATHYLHGIAKAGGVRTKVVNLMIGGCSLETHYKHMNNDARAYGLQFNGQDTGFHVSICEALQSDSWDYVTLQQASHLSINYDTFTPYLKRLSDYVALHAPKAKRVLHQTWAYKNDSHRLCTELGYTNHDEMFADVKFSYEEAADEVGFQQVIPSGKLVQEMVAAGIAPIYRDDFHLSLGLGRYAAAAFWYACLMDGDLADNDFCGFDEKVEGVVLGEVKRVIKYIIKGC